MILSLVVPDAGLSVDFDLPHCLYVSVVEQFQRAQQCPEAAELFRQRLGACLPGAVTASLDGDLRPPPMLHLEMATVIAQREGKPLPIDVVTRCDAMERYLETHSSS